MKKILLAVAMAIGVVSASFAAVPTVKYSGEVNLGFAAGNKLLYEDEMSIKSSLNRPLVETIHGVAIGKYLFVGAGVGLQGYFGTMDMSNPDEKWNTITLPMFVNVKGILPVRGVSPYLSASFGASVVPYCGSNIAMAIKDYSLKTRLTGGFYCDLGLAVKLVNWLNVGVGMQHQRFGYKVEVSDGYFSESDNEDGYNGTSWYLKVGFCW